MEQKKHDEYIVINSYQDIWNYEKRIYTIGKNIKLPTPLSIKEFGYMFVFFVLILLIASILKISLNPIIYIVIPLILTKTVKFLTLDGKNPLLFIIDYAKYMGTYNQKVSLFELCHTEKIYFVWQIPYRRRRNTRYYIEKIDIDILQSLGFKYIDGCWLYAISRWHFLCIENSDIFGIITRRISNDTVLDYEMFKAKLRKKSINKADELDKLIKYLIEKNIVLKF